MTEGRTGVAPLYHSNAPDDTLGATRKSGPQWAVDRLNIDQPAVILPIDEKSVYLYGSSQKPGTTPTVSIESGGSFSPVTTDHFRYYGGGNRLRYRGSQSLIRCPSWRGASDLRRYPFARATISAPSGWAIGVAGASNAAAVSCIDPWQFDSAAPATSGAPTVAGCLVSAIASAPTTGYLSANYQDPYTGIWLWFDGDFDLSTWDDTTLATKFSWASPSGKPPWTGAAFAKVPGLPVLHIRLGSGAYACDGWVISIASGTVIRGSDAAGALSATITLGAMPYVEWRGAPNPSTQSRLCAAQSGEPVKALAEDTGYGYVQVFATTAASISVANDGSFDTTDMIALPPTKLPSQLNAQYRSEVGDAWSLATVLYAGVATVSATRYDYGGATSDSYCVAGWETVNGESLYCGPGVYNVTRDEWYPPMDWYNPSNLHVQFGAVISASWAPTSPIAYEDDGAWSSSGTDAFFSSSQPMEPLMCLPSSASGPDWSVGDVCFASCECVRTNDGVHGLARKWSPPDRSVTPATSMFAVRDPPAHYRVGVVEAVWRGYVTGIDVDGINAPDQTLFAYPYPYPAVMEPGIGDGLVTVEAYYLATSGLIADPDGVPAIAARLYPIPVASPASATWDWSGSSPSDPSFSPGSGWGSPLASSPVLVRVEQFRMTPGSPSYYDSSATYYFGDAVIYVSEATTAGGIDTYLEEVYEVTDDGGGAGISGIAPTDSSHWGVSGDYYGGAVCYWTRLRYSGDMTGSPSFGNVFYAPYVELSTSGPEYGTLRGDLSGGMYGPASLTLYVDAAPAKATRLAATDRYDGHYPGYIASDEVAAGEM